MGCPGRLQRVTFRLAGSGWETMNDFSMRAREDEDALRRTADVPSGDDYEIAAPRASSMLEALRAVGYSVQTALADSIDNSITAGARNVWA